MSAPLRVMHLVDTLDAGGAERVAVELVNRLPRERYRPYLCTTRREGPLAALVRDDVGRLALERRGRFDLAALLRLARFARRERIDLLHAHATALFAATAASFLAPRAAIIWHDHYGRHGTHPRSGRLYRWPARRAAAIIAVNPALASWSRQALGVDPARVAYLPNFAPTADRAPAPAEDLPGHAGARLVCVANFRPQKDHATLVEAMADVAGEVPGAHLLLVGAGGASSTRPAVERRIAELGLGGAISLLGPRDDVPAILRACDLGVLASSSEGLPLALLEYGAAGLAVAATDVGQCAEVLGDGAGLLSPPGDAAALARHLVALLGAPARRAALGSALRARVAERFGAGAALKRLTEIYDRILDHTHRAGQKPAATVD